jgi:large subunit ribosomal protein L28
MSGNNRSHSVRATRRIWNVNLQKFKLNINGKMVEVRMSARAYRALNKSSKATPVKAAVKPVEEKPVEAAKVEEVKPVEAKVAETKVEAAPAPAKAPAAKKAPAKKADDKAAK